MNRQEHKEKAQTISFFALVLAVLFVVAAVMGYVLIQKFASGNRVSRGNTATYAGKSAPEQNKTSENSMSLAKAGIDVTIKDVNRSNEKTVVSFVMSNHQYDLSDPAIMERSLLNNARAENYKVISSEMGGHHVEAELVFPGNLKGRLTVGVTEDIMFTFDL